jgi:hypothetical protein
MVEVKMVKVVTVVNLKEVKVVNVNVLRMSAPSGV